MRGFQVPPPPTSPDARFVCGVPACADGLIVSRDELETVVECDTHESRTTHDTVEKVAREQKIIRIQDQWRQHGIAKDPKGK